MGRFLAYLLMAALSVSCCSKEEVVTGPAYTGRADIYDTKNLTQKVGQLVFKEVADGLEVSGVLEGPIFAPGSKHAFHIHEFGDVGEVGMATGGHYNPKGVQHGNIRTDGLDKAHIGDFGNAEFDDKGKAEFSFKIPHKEVRLADGKYNIAGRSIIVHEKADDFGQPTGNAGSRIAAGVIIITKNASTPTSQGGCCL